MNDRFKFRVWDKQDECYAYSNNSDVDLLYIEQMEILLMEFIVMTMKI